MGELSTNISEKQIKSVLTEVKGSRNSKSKKPRFPDVVEAVAKLRPDATPDELIERESFLENKRLAVERHEREKSGNLELSIPNISSSQKAIDEKLKPEFFILTRLVLTGDYRKYMSGERAAQIVLERWARNVFPDDQDLPNLTFVDTSGHTMPTDLLMNIYKDSELDTLQKKRQSFYNQIRKGPEYKFLRDQLYNVEIKNLTAEEFDELASETIHKLIKKIRSKDKRARTANGVLSVGIESEWVSPKEKDKRKSDLKGKLESADKFGGVPVTYDGLRELPLPYSDNARDQLRAMYELYKMGLVPPEYELALHLNYGNTDWHNGLSEALEAQQILATSDMFNEATSRVTSPFLDDPNRKVFLDGFYRKPLFEGDFNGPAGFNILIRRNGILEHRVGSRVADFNKIVKDIATSKAIFEAAAAWIRLRNNLSENIDKDQRLAEVWKYIQTENRAILERRGLGDRASKLYNELGEKGKETENIETRYNGLLWRCLRLSALDLKHHETEKNGELDFYGEYRKLCLEARRRVGEILKNP